jgi:hypothetical protein
MLVEPGVVGRKIVGRGRSTKNKTWVSWKWQRLWHSPASSHESLKLELSGVGVPSISPRPLSDGGGEKTTHFVSDGDEMLKGSYGGGSD